MEVGVTYSEGRLRLAVDPEKLVGVWDGPPESPSADLAAAVAAALDDPLDFPPLARAVVPGDQVVIAADAEAARVPGVVAAVVAALAAAGVERSAIAVAGSSEGHGGRRLAHDPADRDSLSYLATTAVGRRVYMSREVIDADLVIPVGVIARGPGGSWRGPWSALFPGLADDSKEVAPDPLAESFEVAWLLGNQFQVGLIPSAEGFSGVVAGLGTSVRDRAIAQIEQRWTFRAERRAEVAVLGLDPGAGIDAAWSAFGSGAALVRSGGKVVVLSDARGAIGPAAQRLAGAESFGAARSLLEGVVGDADLESAKRLAEALSWADLYLWSGLDPELVESLGVIPITHLRQVERLVASARDVSLVSHAEQTLCVAGEEAE